MYLYHATLKTNEQSIMLNGLRCGCKPNWEGMSMTNAVYLAVDPDVAIDYVETSDSYLGDVSAEKLEKADLDVYQTIHDFAQHEFYKKIIKERGETEMEIKEVIMNLIEDNNENILYHQDGYGKGYAEGYHDALVDLMNKLSIDHNEEFYN